jgi:D-amino-acid dehydrogenase
MSAKKVVIIGGGIVGLATAYYAARRGHRVTILERDARPGGGCALGSAGMIVPSHFIPLAAPGMVALGLKWMLDRESPFHVRPRFSRSLFSWGWRFMRAANAAHVARSAPLLRDLHLASRACYEEWSEELGDIGLVRKGLLMLCKSEHGLSEEEKTAAMARGLGIAAECLTRRETEALEPSLRFDIAGAVYYPRDCHLTPDRLLAALRDAVADAGVEIAWETVPARWRIEGDRIASITTDRGEVIRGDEYVLAAGVRSTNVGEQLGVRLPMQAGKGYSMTLASPSRLPAICAILSEARVAVTPMGTSLRIGGTMELGVLDESIDPARVRGIVRAVPRYFPDFRADDFRDLSVWCGLRPCSPDGLPYLGRFTRYTNLSAATGHSMMGLSLAPITGKLMAEVLSDEDPSIDIGALSPERYD